MNKPTPTKLGLAICERVEDAEMEAFNRAEYNGNLLSTDIVGSFGGLVGGFSFNCGVLTDGRTTPPLPFPRQMTFTVQIVPRHLRSGKFLQLQIGHCLCSHEL